MATKTLPPPIMMDRGYTPPGAASAAPSPLDAPLGTAAQQPAQAQPSPYADFAPAAQAAPASGASSNPLSAYIPAQTFLGKNYNLQDPAQRMAYFNASAGNLQNQYQQTISQLQRTYGENLQNAAVTNQQNYGQLQQGQYNIHNAAGTGQADQYARSLTKSIADLYNGYGTGLANMHDSYASMSPDAYQSSEGQDALYAQSQYNKGNSDLNSQAASTVGSDFLKDGTLDPNSALGQQYAGYGRQMTDLSRLYNQYLGDQGNQYALATQGAINSVGSGEDQLATQLGTYDKYQNMASQGYSVQVPQGYAPGQAAGTGASPSLSQFAPGSVQTYSPYQLPSTDISQYTPFQNAGQLTASQGANFNGQGVGGGNPTGMPQQTPLQQGLGYAPGSVQGSYAQQYLNGGALVANQ